MKDMLNTKYVISYRSLKVPIFKEDFTKNIHFNSNKPLPPKPVAYIDCKINK